MVEDAGDGQTEVVLDFRVLDPAARHRHVGVGVEGHLGPLRKVVGVAAEPRHRPGIGAEYYYPLVHPINHVDIPVSVHGDAGGMVQVVGVHADVANRGVSIGGTAVQGHAGLLTGTEGEQVLPVGTELLDP